MQNEMRDRLIELLLNRPIFADSEELADYLIANGVIVLPCKVGDMVYELKADGRIVKGIVQSIHQNLVGNEQGRWIVTSWFDNYYADSKKVVFECGSHLYSLFEDFGKTVFLTKEEIERLQNIEGKEEENEKNKP